jgi:type IV pilus modification protein PilV
VRNALEGAVRRSSRRLGFTLVEVIVAMTLLSVGILALAGLSATVMRNLNGAAQQTIAATLGQSRLEQLRSFNCATLSNGSATRRGMSEIWKVSAGTRSVTAFVTVSYFDGRGKRQHTYRTIIPCPSL